MNLELGMEGRCKRCRRKTTILSNGYCARCDNILYGKKTLYSKEER